MKKFFYNHNLSSYFYIQQINNQLLVVSIGPDNPFEFAGVVLDAIHKHTEQNNESDIEIYFDLLSCVGNNKNRFTKLTYNKKMSNSFINNIVRIDSHDLPEAVLRKLKKFYAKHLNEALLCSILSKKEKSNLSVSSII
ncbi:MAG: type II toxin-antitoxin system RnlB family antitoxin [Thermodesulfovibrionia bacterium]|nr:type II toxin-antitoxin system RnlB family antitoxin [Thermodesulfovibrionia bacterium]